MQMMKEDMIINPDSWEQKQASMEYYIHMTRKQKNNFVGKLLFPPPVHIFVALAYFLPIFISTA